MIKIDKTKVFRIDIKENPKHLNRYVYKIEPEYKQFLWFKYKNTYKTRFAHVEESFFGSYSIEDITNDNELTIIDDKLYVKPRITLYIGDATLTKHFDTKEAIYEYIKDFPNCDFIFLE
jgi:hypothetical protein